MPALPPIDFYGVPHLQEALNNAEARYQAGGPGVSEEEIVAFHNHLVDILGLPDYAKLDRAQLRHSGKFLPGLLGSYSPEPGEWQTVTHTLSPMAAAYLEDHLLLNKRFNAGYQMAPGEWTEQKLHEHARLQMADQIENQKKLHEAAQQQKLDHIEMRDSGVDKSREIGRLLLAKGMRGLRGPSLSTEEAAKLLNYATETFKLSETERAEIWKAALATLEGK
jgi:hypothetical protein